MFADPTRGTFLGRQVIDSGHHSPARPQLFTYMHSNNNFHTFAAVNHAELLRRSGPDPAKCGIVEPSGVMWFMSDGRTYRQGEAYAIWWNFAKLQGGTCFDPEGEHMYARILRAHRA